MCQNSNCSWCVALIIFTNSNSVGKGIKKLEHLLLQHESLNALKKEKAKTAKCINNIVHGKLERMVNQHIAWVAIHENIIGKVTLCILPYLEWNFNTLTVDYKASANKLMINHAFDANIRWFFAIIYNDLEKYTQLEPNVDSDFRLFLHNALTCVYNITHIVTRMTLTVW